MCLGIPARIVELREKDVAVAEVGGVRQRISVALVEGLTVGEYVIVHVGYALTRIDAAEAARNLAALRGLEVA
jgi:hydrogenase expression/formation protein HypC